MSSYTVITFCVLCSKKYLFYKNYKKIKIRIHSMSASLTFIIQSLGGKKTREFEDEERQSMNVKIERIRGECAAPYSWEIQISGFCFCLVLIFEFLRRIYHLTRARLSNCWTWYRWLSATAWLWNPWSRQTQPTPTTRVQHATLEKAARELQIMKETKQKNLLRALLILSGNVSVKKNFVCSV